MKTSDTDAAVRALKPNTTTEVGADTWAGLADEIVSTSTEAPPARPPVRRPRLALAGAFSVLIVGVVAATVVRSPGQDQPQALSFTDTGNSIVVRVVDPNADPKRYNAEFKAMGLKVTVHAVPVSAPWVGKFVGYSLPDYKKENLKVLVPGEKCSGTLNASDPGCQEGVEVPKNLQSWAEIQFGRAAKKGELYHHFSSNIDDPGEVLAGVRFRGLTVAQVKPVLAAHGLTIESYHAAGTRPETGPIDTPPDSWYVHDATSYVAGEVQLDVAEAK